MGKARENLGEGQVGKPRVRLLCSIGAFSVDCSLILPEFADSPGANVGLVREIMESIAAGGI